MLEDIYWHHLITLNAHYFGLTAVSQSMASLVLPLLVQRFVAMEAQATALGTLRLWGLMAALLSQALLGLISDHSGSRWGKRRPFIFAGTLFNLLFIVVIGLSQGLEGASGYGVLFVGYVLLQTAANAAQGPLQGLIPDLVPEKHRGLFSGAKAVLEVPATVIIVSLTVSRLLSAGYLWGGLIVLMVILTLTLVLTMLVPELPATPDLRGLDWAPFLRLLLMTAAFTGTILTVGAVLRRLGPVLGNLGSRTLMILTMGALGLLGMSGAVVVGVIASVRLSLGRARSRTAVSFAWWVVNRLAFLVGTTNLASFALYFLQTRLDLTDTAAVTPVSRLMMVVGGALLLSALPSGWLADRLGRKQLVAISGLMAAAGTLVLLLASALIHVYIAGGIIGIATGLFYAANWALGTSLVPREEAGRYLGISNLAGAGAGAVGAYIGGPIADVFTTYVPEAPGLGYVLIFGIYGLLFLISVAALRGIRTSSAFRSSDSASEVDPVPGYAV